MGLLPSDFKAGAYGYYAKLRAEAPVHTVKLPSGQTAWLVSRYDDVAPLLKDARLAKDRRNAAGSRSSSRLPGMLGFLQALERNMLDLDAPDHTRLRSLVHLAFTPRLVDRMRARIEQLSEELVAMVFLLVVAGHETTVNLIGNGVLALMQFPEQLERLRADGGLEATVVEELLRFHSPIEVSTEHDARETIEIAGVTIPTGALVYGLISSANRDETQFDEPDRLDVGREKNRHLAFGQGIHYCLGAPLARLEGQIALRRLLERMPRLRLAVPESALRWRKGLNLRGLETLPVAW